MVVMDLDFDYKDTVGYLKELLVQMSELARGKRRVLQGLVDLLDADAKVFHMHI